MIFTLIMQLLLLLNLLATSFYFQSFFFLCHAVTFPFTLSFDLFLLLFFIKSLKNCKFLSGSPRPPYRSGLTRQNQEGALMVKPAISQLSDSS